MTVSALQIFHGRVFRMEELVKYFGDSVASLRVQLHRLYKSGKIVRLKKNLYTFPNEHPDVFVMAEEMVNPSYHSLEMVLSMHGIIPEGVSAYTLVTSQKTQVYKNIFGTFSYRHLPHWLFFGVEKREDGAFVAVPEKALLDYLYLNSSKFLPDFSLWQSERFDELDSLDWNLMHEWAPKYKMKKLVTLVESLEDYAKSSEYQAHL